MKRWSVWLALALCLCLLTGAGVARAENGEAPAEDITKKCAYRVSEGAKGRLSDGDVRTAWSYKGADAWVAVRLPEDVEAGWLRIEWMFDPTGFELSEYDADQNELRRRDQDDTFPNIYTMFELLPETKYVQLRMTAQDQEICSIRVYARGTLPASVQLWNPPVEKADLMLVSTHQDDEVVFMGGTIPYYATALKKPTIVVYMTNCSRYRRNEALNCLWKMGVRDYPDFINLTDKLVGSIDAGIRLWGGKDHVLELLVARIRRYKPEVIVTHDLNGEYGHNQHKITARAMKYAIDAAADPARYPDSARLYGVWQVKKLYLHLYGKNTLMMDWETPLPELQGYSPLKVARIGMQEQASQLKYFQVENHGTYDNAKFGLYFSTVGPDVAKNDFLENIDPDASARYLEEHAAAPDESGLAEEVLLAQEAPATEESPVALEAPAAEETAAVEETPAVEAPPAAPETPAGAETTAGPDSPAVPLTVREHRGGTAATAALLAAGVLVVGAGGGWYAWRLRRSRRLRRRRRERRAAGK